MWKSEENWVSTLGKFTKEIREFKFKENLSLVEIEPAHNFLLALTTAKYLNESQIDFFVDLVKQVKTETLISSQIVTNFEKYYDEL